MQQAPDPSGHRVLGLSPGDVIGGRYEIVRVLGVGGTGAVFEARHMAIGRVVALKLLLPELSANPVIPQRFLQEARTANEVRHRHIVEVIDFGDDHGRLYMVMEFLRGESLAEYITREAPVSPGAIIRLLEPITHALAAAHARGIVHRDVKPQNIFLARSEEDGEVTPKLIDFGIAKRIVGDDVHLTSTGMILGTPAYMSPEQARADRNVGEAADQYSLGVILYQCLTGRIPYEADTYPALLIQIVSQAPKDIRAWRPDLPTGLADVVMRMLARDPAQRFPSLAALREALRPWRDDEHRGAVDVGVRHPDAAPTRPDGTPDPADLVTVQRAREQLGRAPVAPRPASDEAPTIQRPSAPYFPSQPPSPPTTPSQPASRLGFVAGLVGVAALGMVALAGWLALRPAPTTQQPVTRDASTTTPTEQVTFRIDVQPPTAEITLDGTQVGVGHAEVLRLKDGRRVQLRFAAPGYAPVTEVLVASADARVSRVLVSLDAGAAAPTPTPSPRWATRPPPLVPPLTPTLTPPDPTPGVLTDPRPARRDPNHPRIDPTNPF